MLRRCIALSTACTVLSALRICCGHAADGQRSRRQRNRLDRCDANDNGRVTCAEARAEACGAPIPVTKDHPLWPVHEQTATGMVGSASE